ncbi:MAG: hypothetical protein JSW51_09415 [Gemmatimonadota bacterium]|nr:MAG: hypothetical protein JSW51_09415 [Gemmatimonadota bacterium]
MAPPDSTSGSDSTEERRSNHALREVLDELIEHVRTISQSRDGLAQNQIEYAQERLEWLADEIWRLTVEGNGLE